MAVDPVPGSTVPRRQLGRYLRDARGRARLTVRAAAEMLEWSEAKIWRIETGQTSLRSLDVETMCRVYGTPATLTRALKGLARQTKEKGWWHAYDEVDPAEFDLYTGLEESASSLRQYQSELVPGLVQTADYARAVILAGDPGIAPADLDRRVHLRLQRQALLTRAMAPHVTLVMNEAVVQRPVGGARVMAEQCRRLAEVADLPNFTLHVVPFSAGLHPGIVSGPFVLLRFPTDRAGAESEPPVVYVESLTGALYLEKPSEIERYESAFRQIVDAAGTRGGPASDVLWAAARRMAG